MAIHQGTKIQQIEGGLTCRQETWIIKGWTSQEDSPQTLMNFLYLKQSKGWKVSCNVQHRDDLYIILWR